ncbi:MAG: FIST signal transduction protein, partial [Myxococcales bacterium]
AYSAAADSVVAAEELAKKLLSSLSTPQIDALVVYAAPTHDHALLLRTLQAACRPGAMVGASSAGEFTSEVRGDGLACALALRSTEMKFNAAIGRHLGRDRAAAAQQFVSTLEGRRNQAYAWRAALVMTDALAGYADDFVEHLTLATSASYQFFGGGAGDNAQFSRTSVFFGTEVVEDAAVGLEILSNKPLGIGVGHGWVPASAPMRVTEADGLRLISLNGLPAATVFAEHARATGQVLDPAAPIPFFLHNILGIETEGGHRLRVPLAIRPDGSVHCAAEVPRGAIVYVMRSDERSAANAAGRAARDATEGLQGNKTQVAIFFACVATRLRI